MVDEQHDMTYALWEVATNQIEQMAAELEQVKNENERIRQTHVTHEVYQLLDDELKRVKQERDAAVCDLESLFPADPPKPCIVCKEFCDNDGIFCGRTFYFDHKIYLNIDLDTINKRRALLHELTHAVLFETQINTQNKDSTYTEEDICEFVGKYGRQVVAICEEYFGGKRDVRL